MRKLFFSLALVFLSFVSGAYSVQDTLLPPARHRIAVFAPLYLDSAFDFSNNYRYENEFPKFLSPGLEFYEGVQLALDSLNKEGSELEVFIYDTRSAAKPLAGQLKEAVDSSAELIIAHISGQELFQFARVAKENQIPLINVNLPNDGGITNNPYFVLLNSTLRTHCEGIYRYLQKYHPTEPLVVFRKKGQMEDMIKSYFDAFAKSAYGVPVKMKYVDLPANFTAANLTAHLDSNQKSVCLAASLDEEFGNNIIRQFATFSKSYPVTLVGMPTWDSKDYTRPEFKDAEVVYSTPFYNARTDKVSTSIIEYFNTHLYARPSDMVVRGYETMWKFAKLLLTHRSDIASNLTSRQFNIIRNFDIQPILNKTTLSLDYFENKKLYFVKWQNGVVKEVL